MVIIPRPVPLAGSTPPDVWIGRGAARVEGVRRIPSRDVIEVMNIVGRSEKTWDFVGK